eukprot:5775387-Pyramimonas_sp.AAC.1
MDDDNDIIPADLSYQSAAALVHEEAHPPNQGQVLHWLRGGQSASDGHRGGGQARQVCQGAGGSQGELSPRGRSESAGAVPSEWEGGQQLLTEAYRSRDQAPPLRSTPLDWGDGTNVVISDKALQDLEELRDLLQPARRNYYLNGLPSENGFYTGHTEKSIDELLSTYTAHANIAVYVTDAAGTAGGGHRHDDRFVKGYAADLCAPHTSSNYREFDTGLEGMLRYQAQEDWVDQR